MHSTMADGDYRRFLDSKSQFGSLSGFEPIEMPEFLFDFQKHLVEWAIRNGRAALFADCGLGKTAMQLVWADNVHRKTRGRVLILTPLAVAQQTVREAEKFRIDAERSADGTLNGAPIVVTNYERLQHFRPEDFAGVVCDESSILKNFAGTRRSQITEFMLQTEYRLLCTATAAPNDYMELGTSSEALGVLERKHMLSQFFTHDGGNTASWRLKGHARTTAFWQWMVTWARAVRHPSDLGFADDGYVLPPLTTNEHIVSSDNRQAGRLFDMPAVGLNEQRDDLRRTIEERCRRVAALANDTDEPFIAWCHLNHEGDLLTELIPDAEQVAGRFSEAHNESTLERFVDGNVRVLVTKPTMGGHGLNMQHCNRQAYFPSHSFEHWYQAIRRCWRFGQKRPVTVDVITTDSQAGVVDNLRRKAEQADEMFAALVGHITDAVAMRSIAEYNKQETIPSWL